MISDISKFRDFSAGETLRPLTGDVWLDELTKGLAASRELFLIASPRSRASKYVRKELTTAIDDGLTIVPLVIRWPGKWPQIVDYQPIDFRGRYDEAFEELMKRPPPPRTFWRDLVIAVAKVWDFRPYLGLFAALAIAVVVYAYFFSPSKTSLTLSVGDQSGLAVRVHNRGGRRSMLVGSSFKLDFGSLPIEAEPLVLLQPETHTRIAGHGDVVVRLTADRLLTPKKRDEESYFTEEDLRPLLSGATVTLTAQVKESDDRLHPRSEVFPAERIKNFILEEFPDDVP